MKHYDAFFAYHVADARSALTLAEHLRTHGCELWIYQMDARKDHDWRATVQQALGGSGTLVVVVGPHGVGETQRFEWLHFITRSEQARIVPVLLPGATLRDESIPGLLLERRWVVFRRRSDEHQPLQELLARIGQELR
jgi:hypothetical protein